MTHGPVGMADRARALLLDFYHGERAQWREPRYRRGLLLAVCVVAVEAAVLVVLVVRPWN